MKVWNVVEYYECYVKTDLDEDGVAERYTEFVMQIIKY